MALASSKTANDRRKAGHYEILGETRAKLEFYEHGWSPYSRFLDEDKVDLILRKRNDVGATIYREVQVKYGKLYEVTPRWEQALFDVTSWRFFKEGEFADQSGRRDFYIAYVLARDSGYMEDIFIFPISEFASALNCAIPSGDKRKVCISRQKGTERWFVRRQAKFGMITEETCFEVTKYRRAFHLLD